MALVFNLQWIVIVCSAVFAGGVFAIWLREQRHTDHMVIAQAIPFGLAIIDARSHQASLELFLVEYVVRLVIVWVLAAVVTAGVIVIRQHRSGTSRCRCHQ